MAHRTQSLQLVPVNTEMRYQEENLWLPDSPGIAKSLHTFRPHGLAGSLSLHVGTENPCDSCHPFTILCLCSSTKQGGVTGVAQYGASQAQSQHLLVQIQELRWGMAQWHPEVGSIPSTAQSLPEH